MRRACLIGLVAALVACGGACSHSSMSLPAVVQDVVDLGAQTRWTATGDDPWDVFVCHVPADAQSAVYRGLPMRLDLTADAVTALLDAHVSAYFDTLSHGLYRPTFTAAGDVAISAADEPQACVDKALAASGTTTAHGVLVVADAEHNADTRGGFANPGEACSSPPCAANVTRRSVYVGAADFGPQWGERPPMDLVEHEMGHALGWPHSGYEETQAEPDRSALDVMSNSASPRAVDPERRDAPGTLAVNRLAAGWLPSDDVSVVSPSGATVALAPSNGATGTRLAVVAIDDHRFLAIELLVADGLDDHLPASGVAVHLIETSGRTRTQTPLVGQPPYADLLTTGESFTGSGWSVAIADGWRATIQPAGAVPTVSS